MTDQPTPAQPDGARTVAEGIARVETGTDPDCRSAVAALSALVEEALDAHHRVETLVDVDDEHGQRAATWSGLRREGVLRGVTLDGATADRVVYSRVADDPPVQRPGGHPVAAELVHSPATGRSARCSCGTATGGCCSAAHLQERLGPARRRRRGRRVTAPRRRPRGRGGTRLTVPTGDLLLTDWLPPWGGWDDALCLVFDGGVHDASLVDRVVRQEREIRQAAFLTVDEVAERAADFTARRITAALDALGKDRPAYAESGRHSGNNWAHKLVQSRGRFAPNHLGTPPKETSVPTLSDFTAQTLDGREQDLGEYAGKVVLVVNTASQVASPRSSVASSAWHEYGEDGLVVLGFPCNQFGSQDPGSDEQISEFCQAKYGVTFPMFSKVDVNGDDAHPLYQWLKSEKSGLVGDRIKWNFTKFLVGRDGQVIKRFGSTTKPEKIAPRIEKALAAPAPRATRRTQKSADARFCRPRMTRGSSLPTAANRPSRWYARGRARHPRCAGPAR